MLPTPPFPIIHAVTDSASVMNEWFLVRAEEVMHTLGPRGAIHLRSSRAPGRRFHQVAHALAALQEKTGCWLIVNDRIDVAQAVGARGAQLASHSLQVAEARVAAPALPVGASVHSVEEAVEAEKEGATWCVAGTIFETPSHRGRVPARTDFISILAAAVTIPIIAIGGIGPENVAELLIAGAYGIATIRGVGWDPEIDPKVGDDNLSKTRLPLVSEGGFVDPITRYISAYDAVYGVQRDNHLDGEWRPPAAGTP